MLGCNHELLQGIMTEVTIQQKTDTGQVAVMKTDEELNDLKKRMEALKAELETLSDEELEQVAGGIERTICVKEGSYMRCRKVTIPDKKPGKKG